MIGLRWQWARRALVCLLAAAIVPSACARTLTVGANQVFPTVRRALGAAQSGDVIEIHPGIYEGNLVLDRSVSVIGVGRPLVDLGGRGSGVHIWNSERATLTGNTITQVRDGMYLQNTYHSVIRNNRIFNLRYGLHYMWSDDNVFEDNLFYDNVAGAAVMYSRRIQMRRNVFRHNRGYSSYGILFQENDDCILEDNIISDNAVGIFMEAMRRGTVRRNLISANDVALQVFQSAADNLFENNNFIDNLSPMLLIGGKTSTRWNGLAHGNYWDDYDGYDLDGDGVGDMPHKIVNVFDHLEGNHPRLRLYLFSAAAQALALAERGFPVLEQAAEEDAKPLMRPVALPFRAPELHGGPSRRTRAAIVPIAMLLISIIAMLKAGRP